MLILLSIRDALELSNLFTLESSGRFFFVATGVFAPFLSVYVPSGLEIQGQS